MKYIIYIIISFFLITSCTINNVVKKHGVRNLEKKQKNLIILETNKNDIQDILGPPSSKSVFNNDLWIYIWNWKPYFPKLCNINYSIWMCYHWIIFSLE